MTIAKKILAGGLTEQEAIDRAAWSAKGGCGVTTSGSGFTYTHNTSASGPHNTQVYDATPGDTMTWTLQNLGTTNAITLIYQHQTNGSGTLTLTVSPSTPGTHSFN